MKIEATMNNGIYGIYGIDPITLKTELIYIGQAANTFENRYNSHKKRLENPANVTQRRLYDTIRAFKDRGWSVELIPILKLGELKYSATKKYYTEHELDMMEFSLISALKPFCNRQGISEYYKWSDDK